MMEDRAIIYIYNLHNIEVKKLTVSVESKAKYDAQWDGTDKHGNLLPEGLYIYLIIVDDNIVCEGTVTIAR
jgi:flagellar hook assembly protein FlgD